MLVHINHTRIEFNGDKDKFVSYCTLYSVQLKKMVKQHLSIISSKLKYT